MSLIPHVYDEKPWERLASTLCMKYHWSWYISHYWLCYLVLSTNLVSHLECKSRESVRHLEREGVCKFERYVASVWIAVVNIVGDGDNDDDDKNDEILTQAV